MILALDASATTVWRWVDKSGVVHYSDQPVEGAVEVDLNAQTYSSKAAEIPATERAPRPRAESADTSYQSIAIVQPANESTLYAADGPVRVAIDLSPGLLPGHKLQVTIDGRSVSVPSKSDSVSLSDVERGTHTLVASVLSESGRTILRSAPVTFHVRQPSMIKK